MFNPEPFTDDCNVYVLITKFDKVKQEPMTTQGQANIPETLSSCDSRLLNNRDEVDNPEESITLEKFKEIEDEIAEAFVMKGSFKDSHLRWANFSDSLQPDNVHVDNASLKLLKYLTSPLHNESEVETDISSNKQVDIYRTWLHEATRKYAFRLQRYLEQHCPIEVPSLSRIVTAVIAILVFWIYISLNSAPDRK